MWEHCLCLEITVESLEIKVSLKYRNYSDYFNEKEILIQKSSHHMKKNINNVKNNTCRCLVETEPLWVTFILKR